MNQRSTRDSHEIMQHEHSEVHNAKKVYLVGGANLDISIDETKFIDAVKEGLKNIEIKQQSGSQVTEFTMPEIKLPEIQVVEIEKQVFVPQIETKIIEVPKIVTEIKVVEIEKPIITEVIKTVEVEKPVFIEKINEKVTTSAIILITVQFSTICGLIWSIITKKWGM